MQLIFVGSGDTCRSPLALSAWHLAVREISARGGCPRGASFPLGRIEASSVGICATAGARAALHAQTVARGWGQDLSQHRAAPFQPQHANSDFIVVMTGDQSTVLRAHFHVARGQIRLLGDYAPRRAPFAPAALGAPWERDLELLTRGEDEAEADILDPIGGTLEAYESCAMQIRRSVFELARVVASLK